MKLLVTNIEYFVSKMENLGLPTTFENIVICKNIENKEIVLRSNVKDTDEIQTWVQQYAKNTATSYILRSSKKQTQKVAYMRFYLCHHSSYRKPEPGENKKGKSKNYFCKASIKILVKNNTRMTRQKDPYIKTGLIAVITIRYDHSHSTKTMEAYSRLRPIEETKQKFLHYFEAGHSNASAMKECERNLNVALSSLENSNAQINPTYRTVRYWHGKWLKDKFDSADEASLTQTSRSRGKEYRSTDIEEIKEELLEVFKNKLNQFGCSKRILKLFIKRCRNISSKNAMEKFLMGCGRLNRRTKDLIKVPAASVARRRRMRHEKQYSYTHHACKEKTSS